MAVTIEELRSWGKDNGWDVPDEGRLPTGLRAAFDSQDKPAPKLATNGKVVTAPFEHNGERYELPPIEDDTEETAPQLPKNRPVRSLVDKVKAAAPSKGPRARKPSKARVSVDRLVSGGWRMLAQLARPINLPVARVLDVQAPVAGMILEDIVRNTVVDRLMQPFARVANGGEVAFALMGPPLLVAALQAKPEMATVLVPMLKESLRTWIDVAGPRLEEIAKKDAAFEAEYGTRIDDMIGMFFADPEATE